MTFIRFRPTFPSLGMYRSIFTSSKRSLSSLLSGVFYIVRCNAMSRNSRILAIESDERIRIESEGKLSYIIFAIRIYAFPFYANLFLANEEFRGKKYISLITTA